MRGLREGACLVICHDLPSDRGFGGEIAASVPVSERIHQPLPATIRVGINRAFSLFIHAQIARPMGPYAVAPVGPDRENYAGGGKFG
ncbi:MULTISPECIES: hypothetical protein [unclassified Ruegeria]|uniref:hypothetical protein n=1 Tax=unclassified Ruegeria TaxID=2625375 RepID=UPI001AE8D627|nr:MULTISPECIES: hypothetical protein [unclassified Ruegeria]